MTVSTDLAAPVEVCCPGTADEALALLAGRPESSKLVAGGTAFTLLWRAGLIDADRLISCAGIDGLAGVHAAPDAVRIGALATFRDVQRSVAVARRLPVLAAALAHVGNQRVRNVATWGGNVAEADNTSDLPAILVALDAEVLVRSVGSERRSPVAELIVDFFETTLEPQEMIVELTVPVPAGHGGSYVKFVSRSAEDRTCLGVAAFVATAADGTVTDLRVSAVGAAPIPLRLPEVEAWATGRVADRELFGAIGAEYAARSDPLTDLRGTAGYRKRVLPALVVEALDRALARRDDAVLR